MTVKRLLLLGVVLAGLAGAAVLSKEVDSSGLRMSDAAARLLDELTAPQKDRAVFAFDDPERTNWHFVPLQKERKPLRKGLPLGEMSARQRDAALALVRAGTSPSGYAKATTIMMTLEAILREVEKGGANVRDPGWYFVSLFGTPSRSGRWAWRIEGHHLSLNFVVDRGRVVASTPAFFGANPAHVLDGDRKGLRALPESEDLARELFASLDAEQTRLALQPRPFEEIEQGKPAPNAGKPVGLPAGKMNDRQRKLLERLLRSYADRMPDDVAAAQMDEVRQRGLDGLYFAFAQDGRKPGRPWTYRVHGPTVMIEFLDVQADSSGNPANHIHSAWRDVRGDFGLPRP
jgi:hypothetical protein